MKKLLTRFQQHLPAIILAGVLLVPTGVFAQTFAESDTMKGLAQVLGLIINILTFLALLMLRFFGKLLGTDMITGVEAMRALQPMWVWVRNLTNIMFVGVLLFLSFSHLFSSLGLGGEGGNWNIKEKLPKLIISIIAINFSLLFFKVAIDAINVGTVAILGIADHRLDADVNGLQSGLSTTRTWIKVTEEEKVKMISRMDHQNDIPGDVQDSIKAGDECKEEWAKYITATEGGLGKTVEDCQIGGCSLVAAITADGNSFLICRSFTEQMNDLFCGDWIDFERGNDDTVRYNNYKKGAEEKSECMFLIRPKQFESMLTSGQDEESGQNLFAAFGSVFMHLERLPALGAQINDLNSIIMNTLFSAILSIAFIAALVAVFIAMLIRVIVLWIAIVFSPLLVGASIMGLDGGKGNDIIGKIVTHLIMPLKIAAAFAVGFVMMSAMVDVHVVTADKAFIFGSALSQLGTNEFSFIWQIATIVLFWMAAFWAMEGTFAEDYVIKPIRSAAETIAKTTAGLAVNTPFLNAPIGDQKLSLGSIAQFPAVYAQQGQKLETASFNAMKAGMGWEETGYTKTINETTLDKNMTSLKELMAQGKDLEEVIANKGFIADRMKAANFNDDLVKKARNMKTQADVNDLLAATAKEHGTGTDRTPILTEYGKTSSAASTTTDTEDKNKNIDKGTDNKTTSGDNAAVTAGVVAAGQTFNTGITDNGTPITLELGKGNNENKITYNSRGDGAVGTTRFNLDVAIQSVVKKNDTVEIENVGESIGKGINTGMTLTQKEYKELIKSPALLKNVLEQTNGVIGKIDEKGQVSVEVYKKQNDGKFVSQETKQTNINITEETAVTQDELAKLDDKEKALVEKIVKSKGGKFKEEEPPKEDVSTNT